MKYRIFVNGPSGPREVPFEMPDDAVVDFDQSGSLGGGKRRFSAKSDGKLICFTTLTEGETAIGESVP